MRIAALDMGSNSFHLLVADGNPGEGFVAVLREKETLRLGDAVSRHGRIDTTSASRAAAAARRLVALARAAGADAIVACATSAFREASNAAELIDRIGDDTDVDVQVISGEEEARLVFEAVRASLTLEPSPALCLDLGGGSLELMVGDQRGLRWSASVPLGAARLTAEIVRGDPPTDDELRRVRRRVRRVLLPLVDEVAAHRPRLLVGTSGVLCDLARMAASPGAIPARRVNQLGADRSDLRAARDRLVARDCEARQRLAGLEPRRAELAPAGAEVLLTAMHLFGFDQLTVGRWALREGMVLDSLGTGHGRPGARADDGLPSVRRAAVLELARRCQWDEAHGRQVARLALDLFDQSASLHGLGPDQRDLLEYGALLHDIGGHVSADAHHKHTAYLIEHSRLRGFSHDDIGVLACLGRFHRGGRLKPGYPPFRSMGGARRRQVAALAALLRLADGLDRGRRQVVRDVCLDVRHDRARLQIQTAGDADLELWTTPGKAELFEEVFLRRLVVVTTVADVGEEPEMTPAGRLAVV